MAVFTWFPDASVDKTVEPAVASAKFGDGYQQDAPLGINSMPETWGLTFTGSREEGAAIEAFFRARKGAEAFDWTTPEGMTGRFMVKSWRKMRERGVKVTITCDFVQVFGK